MRIKKSFHKWNLSPAGAISLQKKLAPRVIPRGRLKNIRLVAGCDISSSIYSDEARAGAVVLSFPGLEVVEEKVVKGRVNFPYIPGLLSFREGPLLLEAFSLLKSDPDVVFFDGQGFAHPRRFGLASHLGLWLDRPSVGCAKSRYVGEYEEPGRERGCWSPLKDKNTETIGAVLRTRTGVKPIFVSIGHKVDLEEAVRLTLLVHGGYRIPQPTRLAHNLLSSLG
jgi:deoxyribonuclease V